MTRISDMVVLLFTRMYHILFRVGPLAVALAIASCATTSAVDRARTLSREHKDADAIRVLRARLAKEPNDHAARRLLIRILASEGNLGAARAEVDELRKRSAEKDPTPLLELGHAYELAHRFEEALAAYDDAAKLAPASPAGPREGGMRAARWGEVEQARPRLEEAVARGARDATTWHALGLVCVHLRDFPAAEHAYRAGLAADPKDAQNALGLATVGVLSDNAALALSGYDMVLARNPRYSAAELGRAWALVKLRRPRDAERALDHATELGAPPAQTAKLRALIREAH